MLNTLFNEVLYRPILNCLVFLYNIIPGNDFGLAVILLTFLIIAILSPFSYKLIKSRKDLSVLQPQIKELQRKYKGNKEEQSRELLKLYKDNKVSPFSGCLPMLIQLPILLALYRVLLNILKPESLSAVYAFIKNPEQINPIFLGLVDLSVASVVLAILAAISQFFYTKITAKFSSPMPAVGDDKSANMQNAMTKQMTFIAPIMILIIGLKLPAGLALYWLSYSALTSLRDYCLYKKIYGTDKK